jgi:3-deoxy-D-manno-octulosonic-acid transferase
MRRSQLDGPIGPPVPVLLLDSIGELRQVYPLAAVAVIGGSFLPFGGHNLLEPAALGKAIVFGPHMFNFRDAAQTFIRSQAARVVSAKELGKSLISLLSDQKARTLLGQRALQTVQENRGATAETLALILPHLGQ